MKKIGIIDYFIDEWHSNTYLGLFERANTELGLDYKLAYGYAEIDKEGRLTTKEWCEKNGVIRCETIEELCEKSDNILILAPANPETHLKYAKIALSYGKTTYIDKTFAPDLKTAKEIFSVARKYGTKIFTSSALRYAEELESISGVKSAIITGGGRSLEEYVIHQIEMAVKLMKGEKPSDVTVFNRMKQSTIIIRFGNKTVTLNYSFNGCPFSVDVETDAAICVYKRIEKDTEFYNLIKNILIFFESGKEPFDVSETLAVTAIRDAVLKGTVSPFGKTIPVENYSL